MPVEPPSGRGIAATIRRIDAATDEAVLRVGVEQARAAVVDELRAHTPAVTLAAAWSEVLRRGVAAAVRLATAETDMAWTWFVSGSIGRGEAAPGSDVETLVALDDALDDDAKTAAMDVAAEVHAVLERCGIRGDANGVLGSRPRFCRRAGSWAEGVARWRADPHADRGVVMSGVVADSTAVWPVDAEEAMLRRLVVSSLDERSGLLRSMLQDATAVRATFPSRLRVFATTADTVDLKLTSIDPVVKIARWAALSARSAALPTLERLDAAAAAGVLDAEDVSTLRDCFQVLLRFRWQHRAGAWIEGRRVTDTVSLSDLAPAQRAVLRAVAREVAGIRRKLTYLATVPTDR